MKRKIIYYRVKCKYCGNMSVPDRPCAYCSAPVKDENKEKKNESNNVKKSNS